MPDAHQGQSVLYTRSSGVTRVAMVLRAKGNNLADLAVFSDSLVDRAAGRPAIEVVESVAYDDGGGDGTFMYPSPGLIGAVEYAEAGSYQPVAIDLTLGAAAGTSEVGDTDFLAPVMGNVMGDALTKTGNYVGGVIAHYGVTGVKATTYPAGAVLAGIGDGVTEADAAVVAYIDGDGAVTRAGAAFKVRCNNSTPGSGMDFGVDLQDAAHDGFSAVDADFYAKAPIRLVSDVVILVGAGAPVDGTTGDNNAGPGSIYVDVTNANLYVQTSAITTPVWKLVTRDA